MTATQTTTPHPPPNQKRTKPLGNSSQFRAKTSRFLKIVPNPHSPPKTQCAHKPLKTKPLQQFPTIVFRMARPLPLMTNGGAEWLGEPKKFRQTSPALKGGPDQPTITIYFRGGVLGSASLRTEDGCGCESICNRKSTKSVCRWGVALLGEMPPLPFFLCAARDQLLQFNSPGRFDPIVTDRPDAFDTPAGILQQVDH